MRPMKHAPQLVVTQNEPAALQATSRTVAEATARTSARNPLAKQRSLRIITRDFHCHNDKTRCCFDYNTMRRGEKQSVES
jgi:hypothetical protein